MRIFRYIPHPMIVSQITALLGLYKATHFRTEWPYVVPIHILMYVVHMLQEEFDVYRKYPDQKAVGMNSNKLKNSDSLTLERKKLA